MGNPVGLCPLLPQAGQQGPFWMSVDSHATVFHSSLCLPYCQDCRVVSSLPEAASATCILASVPSWLSLPAPVSSCLLLGHSLSLQRPCFFCLLPKGPNSPRCAPSCMGFPLGHISCVPLAPPHHSLTPLCSHLRLLMDCFSQGHTSLCLAKSVAASQSAFSLVLLLTCLFLGH